MTSVLQFPKRVSTVHGDIETPLSNMILNETDPNFNRSQKPEWLVEYQRKNLHNIMRGLVKIQVAETHRIATPVGILRMVRIDPITGKQDDFGIVSCRLVTTVGVGFIVDAFQNAVELETMRYHGIGTTNTAESASDTALAAELSSVYNPDNTRATGTLTENGANVFRTVGTNTVDGSASIVEHGIFSQAATGGGVLLDRSVFGAISLVTGNALQSTYDFTITAGG